jgi:membrane-associated phospholipid phosphatase
MFSARATLFILIFWTLPIAGHASKSHKQAWELTGDVLQIAIPVTAFAATVGLQDWKGSQQFLKGFMATELTVYALKYAINEERPNGEGQSFPSGHSALAFFGSGFIHQRYGWQYAIPAYAAATLIGYSRVKIKEHWVHDVLGGAAIALLYSYLLTTPYQYQGCYFYPSVTTKSIALHCKKSF